MSTVPTAMGHLSFSALLDDCTWMWPDLAPHPSNCVMVAVVVVPRSTTPVEPTCTALGQVGGVCSAACAVPPRSRQRRS
jgi:hypothetical protein